MIALAVFVSILLVYSLASQRLATVGNARE